MIVYYSYKQREHVYKLIMECPICYNDIDFLDRVQLNCNHHFHIKCIEQWCQQRTTCPSCRQEIEDAINKFKLQQKISKRIVSIDS